MKKLFCLMAWLSVVVMADGQVIGENTVKINTGLVQGIVQEGTHAFLGIPYAEVERFMPPLPVKAWQGVRRCDHWGPQVMQNTNGRKLSEAEMSEKNSCVLNVWTTDFTARKPVMLWIHGGGFDSGASTWNPGMCLAKKDVVVVSLNHRLNILGFLDLSACSERYKYSANVGMLDIVAALRWIRDNISQFGGNPDNVTIFGESGGGGKVGTLMSMPSAKGLFHKAIIMSGTILNVNTKEMSEALGKAVLKELNIDAAHIERINDVPYDELYAAGQRAMAASIGTRKPGTPMMWGFGPTPDGETLLQQPFQPGFAEISSEVPVMIGTTFNELQRLHYREDPSREEARKALLSTFGSDTDEYMAAMEEAWPGSSTQDMLSIDWLFRPKTLITADAIATARKAPTYMYMFNWRSPLSGGSVHGAELMFCFNTLHHSRRDLPEPTAADLRLADVMSTAWAQFAHHGNPNTSDLPAWQPYTKENGEMMIFNYDCQILHNPDRRLQQLINKHCFKQLDEFYSSSNSAQNRVPAVRHNVPLDSIRLSDPAILADPHTHMYYMTGTGGMMWRSADLKLWEGPYIVTEFDKDSWMGPRPMIWAAELFQMNGKYYYFATFTNREVKIDTVRGNVIERRACQVLRADNPMGPYRAFGDSVYLPADRPTLDGTFWRDTDGKPYMVFCGEWLQNWNGTIEKIELKPDFSGTVGRPKILFRASDSPWSREKHEDGTVTWNKVTDGPWLFRTGTGRLGMLWTSWNLDEYTQGVAYSESGSLDGPWIQEQKPVTPPNFGHSMLFQRFDGQWVMSVHSHAHDEKGRTVRIPHLFEVDLSGDRIIVR